MIIESGEMRIITINAYFLYNAYDVIGGWQGKGLSGGIGRIEDQAAEGTWQLIQREGIRVFLEKAPDLSLLPTPTTAQSLQGQNGAVLAKLDSRRYMRERIVDILPYRMAPQIQPCVRLIKVIVRLRETLGNIAGRHRKPYPGVA